VGGVESFLRNVYTIEYTCVRVFFFFFCDYYSVRFLVWLSRQNQFMCTWTVDYFGICTCVEVLRFPHIIYPIDR
jgi:hypothetical protein